MTCADEIFVTLLTLSTFLGTLAAFYALKDLLTKETKK